MTKIKTILSVMTLALFSTTASAGWVCKSDMGVCDYTGKIESVYNYKDDVLYIYPMEQLDAQSLADAGFSAVTQLAFVTVPDTYSASYREQVMSSALAATVADSTVWIRAKMNTGTNHGQIRSFRHYNPKVK